MYMGMSERSETMGLLHLKFTRQSNFPEIQIEGCLGNAIVVLTDVTSDQLQSLFPSTRTLHECKTALSGCNHSLKTNRTAP